LATYWLTHPQRRQYKGIVFAPKRIVPGYYNFWQGFAVEPQAGDCSRFLTHILKNICRGDERLFNWVIAWFAEIFQHPATKSGSSLSIRGKQGVGKTKVGEVIGQLLGNHYVIVADPRYITGRFNSHLVSCLLLHADEAFWAGDHAAEGMVKDLATGKEHLIEFKGKEPISVANYVRLLVTGNPDWIVPAGMEERRFCVLDAGADHREDYAFFKAIDAEMDNGGREALLHYLLSYDLSAVNLRAIPKTAALLDQKLASLTPEQGWWIDLLRAGLLPNRTPGGNPNESPSPLLFHDYIVHAGRTGVRRKAHCQWGKCVDGARFLLPMQVGVGAVSVLEQPGADDLVQEHAELGLQRRDKFTALLNQDIAWGPVSYWQPPPEPKARYDTDERG
jgi:hypothetical protein